ncbi:hypothetical protein [Streptomyces phaeochromogenes]
MNPLRRSTLATRVLGGATWACAAVALVLVLVRDDAPVPRTDLLVTLGLAVVAAAGWALAWRTAPVIEPSSGREPETSPPGRLPLPKRDLGTVAGFLLFLLTPFSMLQLSLGPGDGGLFSGLLALFLVVVTVNAAAMARRRTSQAPTLRKLRVLAEDAAHGEVYAVRVRAGEPVRLRFSERGDKPGTVDVSYWHWIVLRDGTREIRLSAPREDLARAAVRLGGQDGWLCLPKRWKLIDEELPAVFVADSGEAVPGLVAPEDVRTYLTRDLHPTAADRTARRVPSAAKFRAPVHLPMLGGAGLAALLVLPVLLLGEDVPAPLAWLLCLLATASAMAGAVRGVGHGATRAILGDASWTEQDDTDPSIA